MTKLFYELNMSLNGMFGEPHLVFRLSILVDSQFGIFHGCPMQYIETSLVGLREVCPWTL